MCGIWAIYRKNSQLTNSDTKSILKELMVLSEKRGKEASGVAAIGDDFHVLKRSMPSTSLIKTSSFKNFEKNNLVEGKPVFVMGHSRLVTNGAAALNNQPVVKHNVAMVHNGIIVNDNELWKKHSDLKKTLDVDTEILVELFDYYKKQGEVPTAALDKAYSEIYGMASTITLLGDSNEAMACSNNGSLYYFENKDVVIIASEELAVATILKNHATKIKGADKKKIVQLNHGESKLWKLNVLDITKAAKVDQEKQEPIQPSVNANFIDFSDYEIDFEPIKKIRRCTKCVLPETMPYIEFDEDGVCNYCRTYKKQTYKTKEELDQKMEEFRRSNKPLMVSFSGGRDSSYALHYFVKEQGLNVMTYAYDWGMVTDLARRNQSRMCHKLGVEFVVVSADIKFKRNNIKKNLNAWLNKPDLGMIPLLIAGDKAYTYYANKVCKDYGIDNILMSFNPFEKTHFKAGFAGVKPTILRTGSDDEALERLPISSVFSMAGYYGGQYLKNPKYINSTIWDTAGGAASWYFVPHDYFRLFDYIEWNEKVVDDAIIGEYDWEIAPDTKTTWRIGDGTAPFYNYVYCKVAGFTENDTLRSNQIREGMLTRDEALELVYRDNQPRWESMKWYFDTVGVDMEAAMKTIDGMKKLYQA